jgi:hypothetical protein
LRPQLRRHAFRVLGQRLDLASSGALDRELVSADFGAMAVARDGLTPDLDYAVLQHPGSSAFTLRCRGDEPVEAADAGDLLALLEQDVTVELQRRRSDLLFLHAAALSWRGRVCLLAADAGSGKSTTSWGLLHHGFGYLSDELAPVDPASLLVLPYPHALCLKQAPAAYPLPAQALHLGRTIHVPTRVMPGPTVVEPQPLGAIFLLRHDPEGDAPELRRLGPVEATARAYVTALNALAHPGRGLDATLRIATSVPCFAVTSTALAPTCALIRAAVEQAFA